MERLTDVRVKEREALLEALSQQLAQDSRVYGAWLHGSLGRGNSDAWSDIDVWVVVEDGAFENLVRERYEEVSRLGDPVLLVESPQNGPPRGIYLMSGYDGPTGIQLIDWYWQPKSASRLPAEGTVLFMRGDLPDGDPPQEPPYIAWHPTPEEEAANSAALAWAMLAIQAKYIVRSPVEEGMRFHDFITSLMVGAAEAESTTVQFGDASQISTVDQKLDRLFDMADELVKIAPKSAAPPESVRKFISTVRTFCSGAQS